MNILAIDQSLKHTAFCAMNNGKKTLLEQMDLSSVKSQFSRIDMVLAKLCSVIDAVEPEGIVMEDYAYSAGQTNIITQLAELGGVLKMEIRRRGYGSGMEPILRGDKWFFVQSIGEMKKFCLENGNVSKDSRYLLEVFKRLAVDFDNDNEADAYMHAWRASAMVAVIKRKAPISNFSSPQQESLMNRGIKQSKLSIIKAMKLPDSEKEKLVIL